MINEERAKPSAEYWFFSEACNIKNLEESGTFVNALLRKFDRIIIPILSAIFEFVNGNDNLLLAEDENPIISELWLNIFQSQELCQKHLQELALTSTQKPTISKTKQQCQFPFSWLLFNFIKESSPSGEFLFIHLESIVISISLNTYRKNSNTMRNNTHIVILKVSKIKVKVPHFLSLPLCP